MQPHVKLKYSAADIERYLKGQMSPEEAHALERAALDDPFLSDAVDGYKYTKTPAADVEQLREQLQKRRRKFVFLNSTTPRIFLRVAALFVLVAGFGWMVFKLTNNNKADIAFESNHAPFKSKPAQPTVADSAIASGTVAKTGKEEKNESEALKTPAPGKSAVENKVAKQSQPAVNTDQVSADTTFSNIHAAAAPAARTVKDVAAAPAVNHIFKIQVVDEHNNPVPFATITSIDAKKAATADANGLYATEAPDTNMILVVNASGFRTQSASLNIADSQKKVVLQRNEQQLDEAVVVAKSKKSRNQNKVRLEAVEPLEGWSRFNEYVDENLSQLQEDAEATRSGEILLSFDVDRRGNAINIVVEKPLCPSCDSTAVRLIRDGSKWKKKSKEGTAKARIQY